MSGYKNFAVAGAGGLGKEIIKELLSHKSDGTVSSVVILTRHRDGHEDLQAKGAIIRPVDYCKKLTLVAALQEIDVIISAVTYGEGALKSQIPLAEAAKEAGVELFVPSEYGNPTVGRTDGMWGIKNAVRKHLADIGLPYAQFFNGAFIDWFLLDNPQQAFDWENGKVVIKGSGNTPIIWTAMRDVARYVVYVLTHLSPAQLHNTSFGIQGERKTLNEIVHEYQARTGKKLDIAYESREFLEKQVAEHPDDYENGLVRLLYLSLDRGETSDGMPDVNKYWPEFNPTKVVDAVLARWG